MTPEEFHALVVEALSASREAQKAEKAHSIAEDAIRDALAHGTASEERWTALGDTQIALHQAEMRRTAAWRDVLNADKAK